MTTRTKAKEGNVKEGNEGEERLAKTAAPLPCDGRRLTVPVLLEHANVRIAQSAWQYLIRVRCSAP